MPVDYKKDYVGWWKQFSEWVRFERAKNRCECSGECGQHHKGRCTARNGELGKIGRDGIWRSADAINSLKSDDGIALYGDEFNGIGSKVCLTVAHLDNSEGNCECKQFYNVKCAKPDHVLAMCNACHLRYDRDSHIERRRESQGMKKDAQRALLAF